MPLYAATGRGVTDPVLLRVLAQERIDPMGVEFSQDYAVRALGKEHSPYAKFYRNLNGPEKWMVASGLPMVTADNDLIVPGWREAGINFFAEKTNLMAARIQGRDVELRVKNDDAVGRRRGATLSYSPQLFVGGVEIAPSPPVLLPVDPWNPNYQNNVLEWDYGVCKRKLRQVHGRVHGYWVFPANPGGDVLIRYGQTGDYRLKLGPFRQNDDEEFIPASVFASASYPFEVSDSATYYPDADPESTSVDGYVYKTADIWADCRDAVSGSSSVDDSVNIWATADYNDPTYAVYRVFLLYDTSALPDTATVSAATLSVYGQSQFSNASNINIYLSTPASNTGLVTADYDQVGAVAQSTAIATAAWSTSGYNDFALNDMTKISLTGVSKFGAREVDHDVNNSAPTQAYKFKFYAAEQGTVYKPKLVVTYTAITDYPITAAHDRGCALTVTREANFPRTASFAMGFAPSASRAATLARSPSHALGLDPSASRATASARIAAHDLGLDPTASRSWGRSRDASVDMGLEASASRTWGRVREAAVDFGMAVTAVRETAWGRTSDVAAGFAVTASRALEYGRTASHALGLEAAASRARAIARTASHALGRAVTVTRVADFPRTASHAWGYAATASRALGYGRTASHSLGYAVTAARSIVVARTASVAMGLAASVTRGFAKIASVVMGFYTVADIRPRIKRRLGSVGTNRTVGSVGTNRDVEDVGTNRDVESW